MGKEGVWTGHDGVMKAEEGPKIGVFTEVRGVLAEQWKGLDTDTQDAIAGALEEITGEGPGVIEHVKDNDIPLFVEHLRAYMSVEKDDAAGTKSAAADAVRRRVTSVNM